MKFKKKMVKIIFENPRALSPGKGVGDQASSHDASNVALVYFFVLFSFYRYTFFIYINKDYL